MITNNEASVIKLHLLSEGISYTEKFLENFSKNFSAMEKRRAYNDSDDVSLDRNLRVPQEILINKVLIAMNYDANSNWNLDFNTGNYFLRFEEKKITEINFPQRPHFLDLTTENGIECGRIANLYGGAAFALFTPSTCYYFSKNAGCQFCSLKSNRGQDTYFENIIKPNIAAETFKVALKNDANLVKSIMLVGGNIPNYDKGFENYLAVTRALEDVQKSFFDGSVPIETHIATMPPKDLSNLKQINSLNARVTINMEVYDDKLFSTYCSGKTKYYGREELKEALVYAAKNIDNNKVHSILIPGLEPTESTIEGIYYLESIGVAPIINIFHRDKGTILQDKPRAKFDELLKIGKVLQEVYNRNNFIPYWNGHGRNAIDFEALNRWFNE